MQSAIVSCELAGSVAKIVMDDGKSNVVSLQMQKELHAALDLAEKANAVVLLTGRAEIFSAGFDLKVLKRGGLEAFNMLCGGFELAERLLSFPTPVVVACNGHAIAMGVFLLLSGDYRIGAAGPFKIGANEVAIGMTVPWAAIEICRQRLAPAHFVRATLLAETYLPDAAVEPGFLDRVVPAAELQKTALDVATELAKLDMRAHAQTKARIRGKLLRAIKRAIMADRASFVALGASIYFEKLRGK